MVTDESMTPFLKTAAAEGNHNPLNTSDAVFADWLEENGDLRSEIVRRDLRLRTGAEGGFWPAAKQAIGAILGNERWEENSIWQHFCLTKNASATAYRDGGRVAYSVRWEAHPGATYFAVFAEGEVGDVGRWFGVEVKIVGDVRSCWTVYVQPTRAAGEVRRDTYDSFQSAKEFATSAVENEGNYNARVINSKGVEVFNARRAGVKQAGRRKR